MYSIWNMYSILHVIQKQTMIKLTHFLLFLDYVPVPFPTHYQSSCLLGCVNVIDCLNQEQYRDEYPNGESESPYVWICEYPRELSTHFPIRGQHKICKSKLLNFLKEGGLLIKHFICIFR